MPSVLLIDDERGFLQALSEALQAKQKDITVDLALNAEQALLLISVSDYDVIVSDVRMPGMDGLELVQRCRQLRPDSPVVLMTGYGDRELEAQASKCGAYAFLHKPVDADVLLSVISRALLKARLLHRNVFPLPASPPPAFSNEIEKMLDKVKESNQQIRERVRNWIADESSPDKKAPD
jgi:DNA-binding NtrC family response regulator